MEGKKMEGGRGREEGRKEERKEKGREVKRDSQAVTELPFWSLLIKTVNK